MAQRRGVFAFAGLASDRFPEFAAMFAAARQTTMREVSLQAARDAREGYSSQRHFPSGQSPTTLQTINARTDGKRILIVYVGTLRGAIFEFGTVERAGPRGQQPARPYLRPAAKKARERILPGMAAKLPHGRV